MDKCKMDTKYPKCHKKYVRIVYLILLFNIGFILLNT